MLEAMAAASSAASKRLSSCAAVAAAAAKAASICSFFFMICCLIAACSAAGLVSGAWGGYNSCRDVGLGVAGAGLFSIGFSFLMTGELHLRAVAASHLASGDSGSLNARAQSLKVGSVHLCAQTIELLGSQAARH
jgi:hypothetical protein